MNEIKEYLWTNYPMSDFMLELLEESGLNQFSILQLKVSIGQHVSRHILDLRFCVSLFQNDVYLEKLKQFTIEHYLSFKHLASYWKVTPGALFSKLMSKKTASLDQFFRPGEIDLLKGIADEMGRVMQRDPFFVKRYFTRKEASRAAPELAPTQLMQTLKDVIEEQIESGLGCVDYKDAERKIIIKESEIYAKLRCPTCGTALILPFQEGTWVTTNLKTHAKMGHAAAQLPINDAADASTSTSSDKVNFIKLDIPVPNVSFAELNWEEGLAPSTRAELYDRLDESIAKTFEGMLAPGQLIKRRMIRKSDGKFLAKVKCPICFRVITMHRPRSSWNRNNLTRHFDTHTKKDKPQTNEFVAVKLEPDDSSQMEEEDVLEDSNEDSTMGYEDPGEHEVETDDQQLVAPGGSQKKPEPVESYLFKMLDVSVFDDERPVSFQQQHNKSEDTDMASEDESDQKSFLTLGQQLDVDIHAIVEGMSGINDVLIKRNIVYKYGHAFAKIQCPLCSTVVSIKHEYNSWIKIDFIDHLSNVHGYAIDDLGTEDARQQNMQELEQRLNSTLSIAFRSRIPMGQTIKREICIKGNKFIARIKCPIEGCGSAFVIPLYKRRWISSNIKRHLKMHERAQQPY